MTGTYKTLEATLDKMLEEAQGICDSGWSVDGITEEGENSLPQQLTIYAAMSDLHLKKVLSTIQNSDLTETETVELLKKAEQMEEQNLHLHALANHISGLFYSKGENMLKLYKIRHTYIPNTETIPVRIIGTDVVYKNYIVCEVDELDEDMDIYDMDITSNDILIIGRQPVAFSPAPGGYMMTLLPKVGTPQKSGMLSGMLVKQGAVIPIENSEIEIG